MLGWSTYGVPIARDAIDGTVVGPKYHEVIYPEVI
jgi:hypothetical protein